MKVSIKDGKACEKVLQIEVPEDRIAKEFEAYYNSIAPKAKIPGFREGKAPRNVLEMHYKGEAKSSVVKQLITETYSQAVREKTLDPLGYPDIEDVDFKETQLSYKARVEIRPKVKLSKVTGLSAKKAPVELKQEEVDKALQRVRESLAQIKAVEDRPAQMGDAVIADYVCLVDGKETDKREDDWFELKEEEEFLKGFSKQLVGVKAEDEKEVKITFPEKMAKEELAGKEGVFKMKIKEVKTRILPELNDDLAKSAGEFKSLDELKDRIQKDLLAGQEREAEAAYEKELLEQLKKHNKVELPEGLVLRRAEKLVEDAMRQYNPQVHQDTKQDEMKETLKKELEPEARSQIHLAFLLEEIVSKEKIEASDQEVDARMKVVSEQVKQPLDVVQKYYADHPEAKISLREQIQNEKAIEYIKYERKKLVSLIKSTTNRGGLNSSAKNRGGLI